MSKDRPDSSVAKGGGEKSVAPSARPEIEAFLSKVRAMPAGSVAGRGRLVFSLDATMSRQPTWDTACRLQATPH